MRIDILTPLMKQKIFIQQKENEVLALNQTLYLWMFACICILAVSYTHLFIKIWSLEQVVCVVLWAWVVTV